MAFMFEKLEVYQKAASLATDVAALTETFPRGYYFLTDQSNRAALSIATNLAEGNGRFTKPDRKNFFTIARGSVQECVPLLEVARRRSLLDEARHLAFCKDLETIAKMISGLISGLENRAKLRPRERRAFKPNRTLGQDFQPAKRVVTSESEKTDALRDGP